MWQRAPLIRQSRIAVLLATLILISGGCGGRRHAWLGGERPAVNRPPGPQSAAGPGSWPAKFLPPSDLAGLLDAPRRASYVEEDLIKHGKDYNQLLPDNRTSVDGNSVEFDAAWGEDQGKSQSNLAYCMFTFEVTGYDRAPQVRYGWSQPPAEVGSAWIGLANWDQNRWDWFQGNMDGLVSAASLDPYFGTLEVLVAAIVAANDELTRLRWIRLGPPVVNPDLVAYPRVGLPPFETGFNAAASYTDVGTIDNFEWDFAGDGDFELDTDAVATAAHNYTTSGEFNAAVRVTNSYGVQAKATVQITAPTPWVHTWGGGSQDRINDLVCDGEQYLYGVGATQSFGTGTQSLLLLKLDLSGNLIWAKSWGGVDDETGESILLAPNGNLYVFGSSGSFGVGGWDALVQQWTPEGELLWSHTWGGSDQELLSSSTYRSDALYAAGWTSSFAGDWQILVIKFDLDGNIEWVRTLGGAGKDTASDIDSSYSMFSNRTYIHLAASMESPGGDSDIAYLKLNPEGHLQSVLKWVEADNQYASSLFIEHHEPDPYVYICGTDEAGPSDHDVLLAEVESGVASLAKTWGGPAFDAPMGLTLAPDGDFIIGGSGWSFSAVPLPFVVRLSQAGGLEAAENWTGPWSSATCDTALDFASGVFMGGISDNALDGAWVPISSNVQDVTVTWTEGATALSSPMGTTATPAGTLEDITTAVIDTGGGGSDALIMLSELPQ